MGQEQRKLRFYFDYVSPEAFLAWERIPFIGEQHGLEVEPVPVLCSSILDAHGLQGPMEVSAKARWWKKNVLRRAGRMAIPFAPPLAHPFDPILPLRVSCLAMPKKTRALLIDAFFHVTWGGVGDVTDPSTLVRVVSNCGLDGEELMAQAGDRETTDRLHHQTEEAIAAGVFGVPTVRVDDELFWGFDDLEFLERYLAGDDALDRKVLCAWESIESST